jgi:two-component system response regulator AgrA
MIDNLDMEIILDTDKPQDVLDKLNGEKNTGLYFLDIDLKTDITGIELAAKIRELDPRGFIVIITVYPENLPLVFKYRIEALDFIDKSDFSNIRERIEKCIRIAHTRHMAYTTVVHNVLSVKWGDRIISVEFKNIRTIETSANKNDHLLVMNTVDSRYVWSGALNKIEKCLDKRFLRISQSYIINREYITEFNPKTRELLLSNGDKYTVPLRKIKELSKWLMGNETAVSKK